MYRSIKTRIEAIDLFYIGLPKIKRVPDGTQDTLLARVRADDGTYGWGECDSSPLVSLTAYVMPMSHSNIINIKEALIGEKVDSPDDVRRLRLKAGTYGLDLQQIDHAVSAVDIALWDMIGKHLNEPIYRLIGYDKAYGKLPYASVLFGDTPEETRSIAQSIVADGFRAAKFGWGPIGQGSADDDVAFVAAARDGLGPTTKLMVDAGVAWGADDATAYDRAKRFAEYDLTWLEEPLLPKEVGAYRRLLDRHPPVAIAAGEGSDYYRAADDLMVNGKINYIQIDVGRTGGISICDAICRRAQELDVQYVNHTFKSHLQLAASLHVFAGVQQFSLMEYPVGNSPLILGVTEPTGLPVAADGLVHCPDEPGLGVDVNLETVRKFLRRVRIEVDGEVIHETSEP